MISAEPEPSLETLASRLAARAKALAEARAIARRAGEGRWRRAKLLWPLFAKG